MSASTDWHIAYYVADACAAARRAVCEYMFARVSYAAKFLGLSDKDAENMADDDGFKTMNFTYKWQKNRMKEIVG